MVLFTPLPTKLEDFARPVDTSSQVSAPGDAEMQDGPPGGNPCCLLSYSPDNQQPSGDAPGSDAVHPQEEANKALGELLVIKSSIDAHQQKLVWELSMALC